MVPARITPWRDSIELETLKGWFYDHKLGTKQNEDQRSRAILKVMSYRLKGSQYIPHVVSTTSQITTSILLDESSSNSCDIDEMNVRLSYMMSLIRFVNGVLDPTQQSEFAIPLHVLAKKVGLSSWLVDLRHWGTHERDLPGIDILRIASQEALEWLWVNYWNNDELEDEKDNEGEEDEDSEAYQQRMLVLELCESLDNLITLWKKRRNFLEEEKWIWENDSNVITSSNFVVNEPTKKKNKTKKKHNQEITPQDEINSFAFNFRDIWKQLNSIENKTIEPIQETSQIDKFIVKVVLKNFDPLLIEFLSCKINNFEFEVLKWLINCFSEADTNTNTNTSQKDKTLSLLKKRFPKWKDLQNKLLNLIINGINLKIFLNDWNVFWKDLLCTSKLNINLFILERISDRLSEQANNNNNDSWRQRQFKKKKKKHLEGKMDEIQKEINTYVDSLTKQYGESGMVLFYDFGVSKKSQIVSDNEINESKGPESESSAFINGILGDLANLKKRMHNGNGTDSNEKKRKLNNNDNKKYWSKIDDWEPTPLVYYHNSRCNICMIL
ncbi:rRNA-processing protein LAS1 NDAI_0A01050 [Naumovozyma dairenensis CBS 421]|uniref:Las1p n=1 Tax=Naumovozyma dairenensis (strain ATCC 10597 / BCRC 20456 / CBS 421 / NBRC 0211 / NRRL Y-12639) TaxID=1071378 RepID=G0W375_NAUDC|nr:hypothetical protein NDAI_0A01050 [Naumovozyma dairenensis CBS 421]CCD22263.1 hypothetical protein NDAI_0A01050 [Naumovozyma dairenensis CBS 421]